MRQAKVKAHSDQSGHFLRLGSKKHYYSSKREAVRVATDITKQLNSILNELNRFLMGLYFSERLIWMSEETRKESRSKYVEAAEHGLMMATGENDNQIKYLKFAAKQIKTGLEACHFYNKSRGFVQQRMDIENVISHVQNVIKELNQLSPEPVTFKAEDYQE